MSAAPKPPTTDDPRAPHWQRLHLWQIQAVRDLMLLGALVGLLYLGFLLSVITVPLLVALGLAYLVDPLVHLLMTRVPWLGRRGAVLSIMGLLGALLAVVLIITVPMMVRQANQLVKNSDRYVQQARAFVADKNLPGWVQDGLGTIADFLPDAGPAAKAEAGPDAEKKTAEAPVTPPAESSPAEAKPVVPVPAVLDEAAVRALVRAELARRAPTAVEAAATTSTAPDRGTISSVASGGAQVLFFLGNLLGNMAQFAIFVFIVVFCFYFFSTAFPKVKVTCTSYIPDDGRDRVLDLLVKMDHAISGFVRGRLTICCVMGVIYATGWTICGVPHAVLLGVAIGICGLVPYLSAIGLPIAWALLAVSLTGDTERSGFYFSGEGAGASIVWWKVLLFPTVVNVVAQVIEDYVLNPMIQGKATNLHPATILLACIAGGALAGLYGMILAIPVAACLKILTSEVLAPRLKQWLAGRTRDPLPL